MELLLCLWEKREFFKIINSMHAFFFYDQRRIQENKEEKRSFGPFNLRELKKKEDPFEEPKIIWIIFITHKKQKS